MKLRLPKEYLIKKEDGYIPAYILKPPTDVEELTGYILKISQKDVEITEDSIVLNNGNEWNKKLGQHLFMFEKEVKVKGNPSKRYRYTEREAYMLYKHINEQKLIARAEMAQKGQGKLIRASYSDYVDNMLRKVTEWLIAPDSDDKWVYEFYYDPLTNVGKHKRNAKGFSILEEYPVSDIVAIINSRERLKKLLHELDLVREMKIANSNSEYVYNRYGKLVKASNLAEDIAYAAYNRIPRFAREKKEGYGTYPTPESEKFIERLIELGSEIEKECADFMESYRSEQVARITSEIKNLIGIDIVM